MDALLAEKKTLTTELESAIMANQDRFEEPKTHQVGNIGAYGIKQGQAKVEVTDLAALVQFALERGYDDLIRTKHTADLRAIKKRMLAGEEIPGVVMIPAGNIVALDFKKGYAEHLTEA